MAKVSIIVLTYNGLEKNTMPCLESIYKYTKIEDFELIIVDNNSLDGTKEYLKDFEKKYSNSKIILNDKNKGYAGGNNYGIKASSDSYIILLNNDTLVTSNWLENLLYPFSQNEKLGLCGPVTSNAENEQEICFENISPENYIKLTSDYVIKNKNQYFPTNRLIFFCVAIKKEVIEKIGYLNENFKRGFYEDDDYCKRVLKAGYDLAISEGSFVYHRCGGSFSNYDNFELTELLDTNRNLLIKTHKNYSLYTDAAEAFLKRFEKDIELISNDSQNADIVLERIALRLKRFSWQFDRMKQREKFLSKQVSGNFLSVMFRQIKSRLKFIRFFEYKIRQIKKK